MSYLPYPMSLVLCCVKCPMSYVLYLPAQYYPEKDRVERNTIDIQHHTQLIPTHTQLHPTQQVQQAVGGEGGGQAVPDHTPQGRGGDGCDGKDEGGHQQAPGGVNMGQPWRW